MLLCHTNKIALFYVPKTGTTSLFEIFKEHTVNYNKHDHINYAEFLETNPEYSSYSFHAFYREPADRLLSALLFLKQKRSIDMYRVITGSNPADLFNLTEKEWSVVDAYPIKDMLDNKTIFEDQELSWVFAPQVCWLNHDKMELYNFHQFASETQRLLDQFGFTLSGEVCENTTVKDIDSKTLNAIKNFAKKYYDVDYKFFKSKKVQFN